jgi:hypothetical protein
VDLVLFLFLFLAAVGKIIANLLYITLNFFHYFELHFDLHISFLLFETYVIVVRFFLLDVDEMVLPNLCLGLLRHALDLKFLLFVDTHNSSHCIPNTPILSDGLFFKYPNNFGTGKYESNFFHEVVPERVIVMMYVLYESDIKRDHLIKQFLGEIVRVKQFL